MNPFYHAVQQQAIQLSLFDFPNSATSTKVCKTCETEKNLDDFSPQPECKLGRANHCRECVNAKKRAKTIEKHALDPVPRPGYKFCSKCGNERLYPQEFNKRENRCKICKAIADKARQSTAEYQERDKIRHRNNKEYYSAYYVETKEAYRERSRKWRKINPERARGSYLRRKASKLNAIADPVDYKAILERDGYHCYICNKPIDPTAKSKTSAALTFDHKVPLVPRAGEPQGAHAADNIFPAHHACNVRKKNIPFELLTPWHKRGI